MRKHAHHKKNRQTSKTIGERYITTKSYDGILMGSRVTIKGKAILPIKHRGFCVEVEDDEGRIGWIPNNRLVADKGTVFEKYAKKRKN